MDINDAVKMSYGMEDLLRRMNAKEEKLGVFVLAVNRLEHVLGRDNQRVQAMRSAEASTEVIRADLMRLHAAIQVRTTQFERAQGPGLGGA